MDHKIAPVIGNREYKKPNFTYRGANALYGVASLKVPSQGFDLRIA